MFPPRVKKYHPSLLEWYVYKHLSGRGRIGEECQSQGPSCLVHRMDWTPCTPDQWFSENGKGAIHQNHYPLSQRSERRHIFTLI